MFFSPSELARRSEESRPTIERLTGAGCRFLQLEMPDNNGRLRGKIVPLAKGLSPSGSGVSTLTLCFKSGDEICHDAPFSNWENGFPKMVAVPEVSTAVALPWKSDVAAVLCDFYLEDGSECAFSPRSQLRAAEAALAKMNYTARVALEYEVYIVHEDEALMRAGRFSELPSLGVDWDAYSLNKGPVFEELAKEFMRRCESVGIEVEAFHSELGHGMFEYTFTPQSPLKAADDSVRAKLYLKQLCAERGLLACYMAAKFVDTGDSCAGCHHNFSLARGSENAFWDGARGGLSEVARHAAVGMLETMPAFNLLYRPWVNSFRRMNRQLWNPENASWGKDNHMVGIRVVHGAVPSKLTRFEHRAPGADINPYLTIASLLHGTLQGIRRGEEPPEYARGHATESHWKRLPHSMPEAIETWRTSSLAADAFGEAFVEHLACVKQGEWNDFATAVEAAQTALAQGPVTGWELQRYFTHV